MARTLSARSIAAASKRRKARFEVAASGGWKSCALLGGGRRADPLDRPPWVQAKPLTVQLALGVGCSANSKSAGAEHHHDGGWTLRLTVSFELVARVHLRRILRLCLSPIEGGAAGGGRAWPQRLHGDRHLATVRGWGQARAGSNGRCSSAGPPAEDFVVPPVPPVPRRKIWERILRRQSAGATAERRASAQVPVPSAPSVRSPSWIGDRHKRIHLVTGRWGQAQAQAQAHPDPSHTAQKNPQRKRPGERRLGFARIPQERIWWAADSATPALGLRWLTRGGAAPPARRGRARSVETLAPRCGERGLGRATRRTGRLAP